MGETGPLVEEVEAEAEFEAEAATGLLDVEPPAVPGLSLNSERSRSICFLLYSSGIQTSLLVLDLFVCDPARLDLFEAFAYAGRASDVTGDEDEGLVALGLAEEEAFGLAAFIFTMGRLNSVLSLTTVAIERPALSTKKFVAKTTTSYYL